MPLFSLFRGCPGVPVHEGIPFVFITIHGVMTQFVNVFFFCVPVHEDTTLFSFQIINLPKVQLFLMCVKVVLELSYPP